MTRPAGLVIVAAALAGCAGHQGSAPVVDRTSRGSAAPAPPVAPATPVPQVPEGHYLVKRGDTLYSIALEHGADYREVAQWNALDDPAKIRAGQVLRVKPDELKPAAGAIVGRIETRPMESRPLESRPLETKPAETKSPETKPAPAVVKDSGEFIWPARGKILAGFAEPRSKGIDIDGRPGDSVVAAAAGRVTYTGSGIPGLGQLVVIRHDNGFITVYAHNRRILVKEQQNVTRGQKIAEIGSSDADRPKLHFQIRKGSAAVDPLRYLPAL
jgi:lipoprotein NlpD